MNLEEKLALIEDALRTVQQRPVPDRCNPFGDIPGFYWVWRSHEGAPSVMIRVEYCEKQRVQEGTTITLQLPPENISVQYRGLSIPLHDPYNDERELVFNTELAPNKLSAIDGLEEALAATRDLLSTRLGKVPVRS